MKYFYWLFERSLDTFLLEALIRLVLALLIGTLIGSERAKHGRAAGMRTHAIVCIGAALTAITSIFVSSVSGLEGDVFRVSAQVISGISFLGAGMIILKDNDMITGLTTAAGVWATASIGLAVGYGFYSGAIIATLLIFTVIVVFTKFEKIKNNTVTVYVETDDISSTNRIIKEVNSILGKEIKHRTAPPKSGQSGHLGIYFTGKRSSAISADSLLKISGVVYTDED